MALVVEDGTGVTGADSYVSIAEADTYAAANGLTSWASATAAAKEIALRQATRYVDTRYRFRGSRLGLRQPLEWPRGDVVDGALGDGYYYTRPPRNLKAAVTELESDNERNAGQVLLPQLDWMLREITVGGMSTVRVSRA